MNKSTKPAELDTGETLSPREILTRDSFTTAETAVFTMVIVLLVLATWLPPILYWWVYGMGLCFAILNPAVARLHSLTHPFFVSRLWQKWLFLQLPFWVLLLLYLVGQLNPSLTTLPFSTNQPTLHSLSPPSILAPSVPSVGIGWDHLGSFAGAYLVAMMLFMVPKSRAFFLRLLPWLGLNAVLLALLGYLQRAFAIQSMLGLFETDTSKPFFATFPGEAQWLAFAILWAGVLCGLCLLHARMEKDVSDFSKGLGPWYGSGALILIASGLMCESSFALSFFWLGAALLFGFLAGQFFSTYRQKNLVTVLLPALLGWAAAIACLGLAWGNWQNTPALLHPEIGTAWEMLRARPWFGWGADAFSAIAPFFSSDFAAPPGPKVGSDPLQWLSAFGWLGTFLALCLPLALLGRDFKALLRYRLSLTILLGLLGAFAISCLHSVFNHYGFTLSFWLLFFAALRWSHISQTNADRVDHAPYLIFKR